MAEVNLKMTRPRQSHALAGRQALTKVNKKRPFKRKSKNFPLDLNVCPPELMGASSANATEVPLLQLPAEIRLRILELVIGDSRCIEIGYACPGEMLPGGIPFRSPAEIIIPGPNTKGLYLAHQADYESFPRPHDASSQWAKPLKVESRFHPLNRICRQIYHETMSLPYTLHTFAFGNLSALKAWVASLTSQQKVAVRSIFYADFVPGDVPTIADITLGELPGLNRIFLPASFRRSQSANVHEWLEALRSKDLKLLFLERPDHVCRYVKVKK